jgi:hypothetical protein
MSIPRNAYFTGYNAIELAGETETIGSETIYGLLADGNGDILFATGLTVPTDANTGYAKGCLFIDTDVATGTTGLYCNKGTNTSCAFTAVTQA